MTAKVVASATAKTVPGIAHGSATSRSSSRPSQPPLRSARRAATNPSASAPSVATLAIQIEFSPGRSRSVSENSTP